VVDAVVVGAGLAGLACARHLHQAGLDVVVLEAADAVGGRVRTDEVDGFLLDRGFQALLTAYPEAQRVLDLTALDLAELYPGALVRAEGAFHRVADPFRRPFDALRSARAPVARLRDYRAVAQLRSRTRGKRVEALLSRRETSAAELLGLLGLSDRLVERFFRPLLAGMLLDPELESSSRMVDFLVSMVSSGHVALPAEGMEAIPRRLASELSRDSVRLEAPVERLEGGAVLLASGERLEGRAVVVATDGAEAARLVAEISAPAWRGTTCLYFAADEPPVEGPLLVLNGEGAGPVNHLCVLSQVAPSYAPEGAALVSANVLGVGGEAIERAVLDQLRSWFGEGVESWRHLRTYEIERALPAVTPPALEPKDRAVRLRAGLYVCGDHRETPSIQGALVSGRRAAQALVEELRR
jgi:phytoene dehydrogenase-like protein